MNTQLPDNGGVAGDIYWSHLILRVTFEAQLAGPFPSGARAELPPTAGSLDVASEGTIPVQSLLLLT